MTPADMDPVFGRGRLRMVTGDHVQVFREAAPPGQHRRYTKRFLVGAAGDLRPWTERERRILDQLARQPGAPVAKLAPSAPARGGLPELQTWDAGPTVDHWATRVLLRRAGKPLGNVFEECASWWSLARQCLLALDTLHALGFVHLDLKADNLCIPWGPAASDAPASGEPLAPRLEGLALIDVAFSLLPGIGLPGPLPLARQPKFEYQSPRLLQALEDGRNGNLAPTLELDWRCDFFSLAALLWRYLPEPERASRCGWSTDRHAQAAAFLSRLVEADTASLPAQRPHGELIALAGQRLCEPSVAEALQTSCTFDSVRAMAVGDEPVPRTRFFRPLAPRVASETRREPSFAAAPAPALEPAQEPAQEPALAAALEPMPEPKSEAVSPAVAATPLQPDRPRRTTRIPAVALAGAAIVALGAAVGWWEGLDSPAMAGVPADAPLERERPVAGPAPTVASAPIAEAAAPITATAPLPSAAPGVAEHAASSPLVPAADGRTGPAARSGGARAADALR